MPRINLKRLVVSIVLPAFVILMAAPGVAAVDPFEGVRDKCGTASDSTVCNTTSEDPLTGQNGVIRKVTLIFGVLAGVVAVIAIVLSGIRYITSGGDAEGVSQAKKTIIFAAVGLIVIVVAQTLINFVLNRI